jgi:signal transduction histidine kinase
MPIIFPDGTFFGTLCAIDPHPARLNTPETIGMFKLFADLIAFHINARRQLAASEASLLSERQSAELREQFIAVLGHDLRNPVASINGGARMLLRTPLNEKAKAIVGHIESSVGRMSELIDNVLDFARGRLGGGLAVTRKNEQALKPVLEHVIDELRAAMPDRIIETDFLRLGVVDCDPGRIGQLLSNLVGNALTHGAPGTPVRVRASAEGGIFELSVANSGEPIAPATIEHLFKPFFRAAARPHQQGLGLGLYIASEIARAHDGTLTVSSSPDETRFTFRMPQRP